MSKHLIPACADVEFRGFRLYQVQDANGNWQGKLHTRGILVDDTGTELPLGQSPGRKIDIGPPKVTPYTIAQFETNISLVFTKLNAWLEDVREEYAGIVPE